MNRLLKIVINDWVLGLNLLISLLLRLKGLNFQSLWLDELHTMNEANPNLTWGELFGFLKQIDQHPPLYFITERLAFDIFGYTEFAARFISVIAGTVSIWAMFRLGKEVLNKSLGTICAIITAVNFYNLSYSQEARPYIFAFLFAALSFTYFIRLVKAPSKKTALYYALFTLLLLYSHYYSLFAVAAQVVLALIFILQEHGPDRKVLSKYLFTGFIVIAIGYLPCLPFLISVAQIKSFWIQDIPVDFMQRFFYGYFGDADLLNPLLIILLSAFFIRVSMLSGTIATGKIKDNPLLLSFTIIFTWIAAVLFIPYLRSLITVPMLYPRYTIVLLPAIILALAYSIELFKIPLLKYLLTGLFVGLSLINLFFVKKYYTTVSKTQFREMSQYVVQENPGNLAIFNEVTAWHQQYYLTLFGSKAEVLSGNDANIDSIINKQTKDYARRGFWIVGAHGTPMPDKTKLKALDTAYTLLKERTFYDAWALFYMSKRFMTDNYIFVKYDDFAPGTGSVLANEKQIAIWKGAISTKPVAVKKGRFEMAISAMGTSAANVFPHLNIYMNGKKIANYFVTGNMEEKSFDFDIDSDKNATFTIEMDNDLQVPPNQDRNTFVQYLLIKPLKQ
jgi:mannosyltransferase